MRVTTRCYSSVIGEKERRATCIRPQPKQTKVISYKGKEEEEAWLSELPSGMKIHYKTDSYQMGFLQLMSAKASQQITFHCKNTVAYKDEKKDTLRFKWIELLITGMTPELTPTGPNVLRYEADEDGLQSKFLILKRSNSWDKSILTYTTDKSQRLPIVDIAVRDIGNANQEFRIELGAACFY
ncbi:Collagen alpha-1(II) chain [Lucilia cuprina]|nr:Collagen alpha-1(II) chain [Lucilia cuprina]